MLQRAAAAEVSVRASDACGAPVADAAVSAAPQDDALKLPPVPASVTHEHGNALTVALNWRARLAAAHRPADAHRQFERAAHSGRIGAAPDRHAICS